MKKTTPYDAGPWNFVASVGGQLPNDLAK